MKLLKDLATLLIGAYFVSVGITYIGIKTMRQDLLKKAGNPQISQSQREEILSSARSLEGLSYFNPYSLSSETYQRSEELHHLL